MSLCCDPVSPPSGGGTGAGPACAPAPELRARFRGCLLGLAVGDALGATLEFRQPGTFPPLEDLVGGGPFHLHPGQWTDDTSMALCLATSLLERDGFNARDQMDRYVRWWRQGWMSSTGVCFDIGTAVLAALHRYLDTGDPWAGAEDPRTAGNGSLVRLAPVVLFYAADPRQAVLRAADSSRTTHAAPAAVDACRYFAGLLWGAVQGWSKDHLLAPEFAPWPGQWLSAPLCPEVRAVAAGSFWHREPPDIRGAGSAVECLEAALWAFARTDNFRDGLLRAVNLGNDADSTGAVYGQLAGAFYGEAGIPAAWRQRLHAGDLIATVAERLFEASSARTP